LKLPEELKPLFWNYDTEALDTESFKKNIILEVLSRGSLEHVALIFQLYGWETIAAVFREDVTGLRTLPAPAAYLWGDLLLTGEEVQEYKKWHRHPLKKWEQRRTIPH